MRMLNGFFTRLLPGLSPRRAAARLACLAFCLGLASAMAQTLPQKPLHRDDLAAGAQALEERVRRDIRVPANADAAELIRASGQANAQKNPRLALQLAHQAAAAAPQFSAVWRHLARMSRAVVPKDWREKYDLAAQAQHAAYRGYQRSRTREDDAQSLALLGSIFEWQSAWRPALTAYRMSLDLADAAELRKTYEALREKRGFRVLSNAVDADSPTPRACFTFSEPLQRGRTEFAPYVAITGRGDFAVTAEESQICVEGLRHGERYGIVLRQGIPSVIPDEVLAKNADYEIYVRDRSPSVRASGKTYVLPRSGQQGIPVTSVNTDAIGVRVLRIGDRNLINTVRSPEFLSQIEDYKLRSILDESGQQVWQGMLAAKSELNRDVITAFPVTEATGPLQPGVYVLVAKVGAFSDKIASADEGEGGETLATQWFIVSDLGLTSFSGSDGLHVLVRGLGDAKPVANAEIRLIARNNEVLGTTKTDAEGHARFDAGLSRGEGGLAAGLVTASLTDDYGFLDLQQTAFDLSDRGVSGRIAPKGLDAYLYAERGVYRPGETVQLVALLRDARGNAVSGMPLTLLVRRPDGMEYRRVSVEDQGAGGRALSIALISGAPTGTWRVQAYADPKRPAIGETSFLVEDYVPERLAVTLSAKSPALRSGQPAEIDVNVRYLYGAPGADLAVSGETVVRIAKGNVVPGLEGFQIGITDEEAEPVRTEIETRPTTDEKGEASLSIDLKEPETRRLLEAEFTITANESGGRGVTRSLVVPILPKGNVIGVKSLFGEGELGDGATARFGVVLATGEGKRLAQTGLKWQVSRVNRRYQWFFKDGRWAYEAIRTTRRVADGELATSESAVAEIAAKVGWGTYRIEVRAPGSDDAETAYEFTSGYVTDARADTPDMLDLVLDKKGYAAGETMQVRVQPRFAGTVTLAIVSDRIATLKTVEVPESGATIPLKVAADWGAGAYVVALAHRPLDAAAKRMPGRSLGLAWFAVDGAARTLSVNLGAPAMVRPRGTLDLPLAIGNLKPNEEVFVTVAAVDIGILNLTRYVSPNASKQFFGQRQLSGEWRDLYGFLIDGMQGTKGAIRSGGDGAPEVKGEKPTQEPLARFSGVVKAGPDGRAPIRFDLPAFNGAVRVMAVAWSKERTGEAEADVIVRDPIIVQATTPRFLALGDRSRLHVEINNVEGETGDYALDIDVKGPISTVLDPGLQKIRLEKGRKAEFTLPVIGAGLGMAELTLTLKGPNALFAQALRLPVRSSAPSVVNRIVRPLPAGQSLTISTDLLAELVPQSGAVALSASPFAGLDAASLLVSLDRYPYGCTEQTVSRAMPLLYVNALASLADLGLDDDVDGRITKAIERVMARQGANGSFGLWAIGGGDLWLDAFTVDFLTRARERNFTVPQTGFTLALDNLRNSVVNIGEFTDEQASGLAYATYVLARNGRPVMGDLRYLVDNKLKAFPSPMAKGQLGAALALLGDRTRAKTAFDLASAGFAASGDAGNWRADYGTKLRDGAGLLALMAEARAEPGQLQRLAQEVDGLRARARYTSTQEQGWMVLAAQALARETAGFALDVDGQSHRGAYHRSFSEARLEGKPVTLRNLAQTDARVTLNISGIPLRPEGAASQGYTVSREIFTLAGDDMAGKALRQNERYVVRLTVERAEARRARLLVVDPLPAGIEIENANLGGAASLEGLDFLGTLSTPEHSEARDDRFAAAFDDAPAAAPAGTKAAPLIIAYIMRAVTPGSYIHPAATAEDMYRPERFGRSGFGTLEVQQAKAQGRP